MGFLDRFKGKKEKQPEQKSEAPRPRPVHGTVSMLWGPSDRRPADQDELKELQESMSASADEKIAKYKPVLDKDPGDPGFEGLSCKEAGLLQIINDNYVVAGGMPKEFGTILGMDKKEWAPAIEKLSSLGYIVTGDIRVRINDMKYSVLLEKLKENGITISTSDKVARVEEIIGKTDSTILEGILSEVPIRYSITAEGVAFLDSNPVLGEYYNYEDHGITIGQACILKSMGEGELFTLCQRMYMELMEAYWSKAKYKEYMEYSEKLAYLNMRRCPKEAAYALAHLINANSVYKSGKIFWEVPLKTVYAFSDMSVNEIARYAADEFAMGIYPKRTKVDKFQEVFTKYLKGTEKKD